MKNIVIINQTTGYLTEDIAEAYVKEDFQVTLLSSQFTKNELFLPYKVIHITPYDRSSILKRIKSWWNAYQEIKKYLNKIDKKTKILYFSNPPFSYFASKKLKNPFSIVLYDLYPDALNNIPCPEFIKKYWAAQNKKIFPKADKIYTLSEGMKKEIENYCEANKIKVIPLWVNQENPVIVPENENKFLLENGIKNKFIILYSGNMGLTHNLEPLIEVARQLKDNKEIMFVFIGEGGKKQKLIELSQSYGLENCRFYPYLPEEDLKYSLSGADIGVVSVSKDTANISVPSKTFNLLSYHIPILALSPEASEINALITKYGCGKVFNGQDIYIIKDWILKCVKEKDYFINLRKKSFEASKDFTKENAKQFLPE